MKKGLAWGIAVFGLLGAAPSAQAGTVTVNTTTDGIVADGLCSLREAVSQANVDNANPGNGCSYSGGMGNDTITVSVEPIVLTGAADTANAGDLEVTDTDGLTIQNPSTSDQYKTIQQDGPDRVFENTASLTLDSISVTGGDRTDNVGGDNGAGIRSLANLTLIDSLIDDNDLIGTSATLGGGGIHMVTGNLTMTRTWVLDNSVLGPNAARGGGVLLESGVGATITDSFFQLNSANMNSSGAALGGGLSVPSTNSNASIVTITGTTFRSNDAIGSGTATDASGGAIYWHDVAPATAAKLTIDNSTFDDNEAKTASNTQGGAIYFRNGDADVSHLTLSDNVAGTGSGDGDAIYYSGTVGSGDFGIRGSLFNNADVNDECEQGAPNPYASAGYNIDRGASCSFAAVGDTDATVALSSTALNGGPTPTRALQLGSIARNHDATCLNANGAALTNDQRGAPRSEGDPGAGCSAGAYELITCGLTPQRVTVTGTAGSDPDLVGTAVDDVIAGFGGDDVIEGDAGDDTICGGQGNDTVDGGAGGDTMLGGGDTNTLDFGSATAGVTADLNDGSASGGSGNDTFADFRHIVGSAHDDTLSGDALNNNFDSEAGNDTLEGRGGLDDYDATNVTNDLDDRVVFDEAPGGVNVSLSTGTATGDGGSESLLGIENVTGSGFPDTFSGSTLINELDGGGGADTIDYSALGNTTVDLAGGTSSGSGGANDFLTSIENASTGVGNDTLVGDAAANILQGGDNTDTITGNGGADTLSGQSGTDAIFARDSVADIVNCGTQADTAEVDVAGTDTVNADCETVDFAVLPPSPPGTTPTTPTTPATPVAPKRCKKGQKLRKGRCVKKKRKKK